MRKLILEKLKTIDLTSSEWDKFMFGGTNIRVLDFNDIPDSLLLTLYTSVLKHAQAQETKVALNGKIESQAFYELCQQYRHCKMANQAGTVRAFDAIKNFIQQQ